MADFFTFHSKYSPLFHPTLPKFCQNHTEIKIISPLLFENFPYFTLVLPLFHQSFTLMICPLHPQFSPNYQSYGMIHTHIIILPLRFSYFTLSLPLSHPFEFQGYPYITLTLPSFDPLSTLISPYAFFYLQFTLICDTENRVNKGLNFTPN